jgi:regulator of nonsense transcripts 3
MNFRVKVLKNTERTDSVVSERSGTAVKEEKKTNEGAALSTKKPREDKPQRSKELKSKERPPREKKDNQRKTEKKPATGETSEKKEIVKHSEQGKDIEKKNEVVVDEPTVAVVHEKKADESGEAKNSAPEEQEERTEGEKTEKPERVETERERKERIRNKDRPAMQIYRPGAKRSTVKPVN